MAFKCLLLLLALFFSRLHNVMSAYCHGKHTSSKSWDNIVDPNHPDPGAKPNTSPIETMPPTFLKSVKNGKLYSVGKGDDLIHIVHVWGSPYEMGYAQGELMKDQAHSFMDEVWDYMEKEVEAAINGSLSIFPSWFLKDVANIGLDAALDVEIVLTEHFTGPYFLEEIKGLADSCGVDYKRIERIHMLGELTKGQCSMFGANSSATPDGSLLQLRALDWNVDGPFKNYPQVTVYHPNKGNGHAFANVGWTGWIGSITGMSSASIAISEIGVSFPDDSFGQESRLGTPFTYLLRDILQFDDSLNASLGRIRHAHRTCNLILGVGDGKVSEFNGIEYSASVANFFTWQNLEPDASWHPKIENVVYWGMDWLCPGYSIVLAEQLQKYHGNITATITIREIVPIVQTGDLHIAIYDFVHNSMYVANARGDGESGPAMAYDRSFIRLDMSEVFKVDPPV